MKRTIVTILLALSTTFAAQGICRAACDTCDGGGLCHVCEGSGVSSSGGTCYICSGSKYCYVCKGSGTF